jgi:hypothetical protein
MEELKALDAWSGGWIKRVHDPVAWSNTKKLPTDSLVLDENDVYHVRTSSDSTCLLSSATDAEIFLDLIVDT